MLQSPRCWQATFHSIILQIMGIYNTYKLTVKLTGIILKYLCRRSIVLILLQSRIHSFLIKSISFLSQWSLKVIAENGTAVTTLEKSERPVIKECVDRNKYCTDPPVVSFKFTYSYSFFAY